MSLQSSPYDEAHFLSRLVRGDQQAFTRIVHHYYPRLVAFASKITKSRPVAEELIQDVFLKLWTNRADMGRYDNAGAWLFRVAGNLAFNWLKRAALEGRIINQMQSAESSTPVEEYIDFRQSSAQLQIAVNKLPEQQRTIFRMSKEQGMTNQEIADQLGLSPNTVKNHLSRALHTLREHLGTSHLILLGFIIIQQSGR